MPTDDPVGYTLLNKSNFLCQSLPRVWKKRKLTRRCSFGMTDS